MHPETTIFWRGPFFIFWTTSIDIHPCHATKTTWYIIACEIWCAVISVCHSMATTGYFQSNSGGGAVRESMEGESNLGIQAFPPVLASSEVPNNTTPLPHFPLQMFGTWFIITSNPQVNTERLLSMFWGALICSVREAPLSPIGDIQRSLAFVRAQALCLRALYTVLFEANLCCKS